MKYKNVPELDIELGDEVRFICEKAHEESPEYSPAPGTVGTVIMTCETTEEVMVRWPDDSGVNAPYKWWTFPDLIAFVSRTSVPA